MKTLLLLPLLALLAFPDRLVQTGTADGNQITMLSFKWSKSRQKTDTSAPEKPLPACAIQTRIPLTAGAPRWKKAYEMQRSLRRKRLIRLLIWRRFTTRASRQ